MKILQICEKSAVFVSKMSLQNGAKERIVFRRELSNAYFELLVLLKKLASIQLITSPAKFARSPRTDPPSGRARAVAEENGAGAARVAILLRCAQRTRGTDRI